MRDTPWQYKLLERDDDNYTDWNWVEDAPVFDTAQDGFDWLIAKGIHPLAIEKHYRAIMV